jgi:asparagine synthase (glutamine-hydrolysing)
VRNQWGGPFGGGSADSEAVSRMTAALRTRGPDGSGCWKDGWVSLGHRRLSIIDLSENGAQPMVAESLGVAVSFNGCIYNYRQLRGDLRAAGYEFRSTSDTEVILAAYHRCDVDTGIDTVALHHYLSWHAIVPAPRTILKGVRKLPPATVRVIDSDGRSHDRVYWRPEYVRDPADAGLDEHDWQERLSAHCAPRSSDAWWRTCPSACCSPVEWTRA